MKLSRISASINCSIFIFALMSSAGHAGEMQPTVVNVPGKFYVGVFGGYGSSNNTDISQYGTAFFLEDAGGPLAVDAFGHTNNNSTGLIGIHFGYKGAVTPFYAGWSLVPAIELEGYYLGKNTLSGEVINDEATRLDEHDFIVKYPTKTGVFLTNAVVSLNSPYLCGFQPYLGVGIGGAVLSVSNASALQISPPEPGVNHYNASTSDTASTFAGQIKTGLSYNFNESTSLFVEYRWLYLASTHYIFGSTIAPGHAVTSPWHVKLDSQYYNMGTIGIQYSI